MIVRNCAFCCAAILKAVKKNCAAMKTKDKMKVKGLLIIIFKSLSYGQSSHNLNALMVTFAHYLLMSDGRKNNSKSSSAWFLCALLTLITMFLSPNDASTQKIYKALTPNADTSAPKTPIKDTIPVPAHVNLSDTIPGRDSLKIKDTLGTDSLITV